MCILKAIDSQNFRGELHSAIIERKYLSKIIKAN